MQVQAMAHIPHLPWLQIFCLLKILKVVVKWKSFVLATLCQTMGGTLTIFTYCWLKLGNSIFTYIRLISLWAVFMYCFYFWNIKYTRSVTLNHDKKWKLGMHEPRWCGNWEGTIKLQEKRNEIDMIPLLAVPHPTNWLFVSDSFMLLLLPWIVALPLSVYWRYMWVTIFKQLTYYIYLCVSMQSSPGTEEPKIKFKV